MTGQTDIRIVGTLGGRAHLPRRPSRSPRLRRLLRGCRSRFRAVPRPPGRLLLRADAGGAPAAGRDNQHAGQRAVTVGRGHPPDVRKAAAPRPACRAHGIASSPRSTAVEPARRAWGGRDNVTRGESAGVTRGGTRGRVVETHRVNGLGTVAAVAAHVDIQSGAPGDRQRARDHSAATPRAGVGSPGFRAATVSADQHDLKARHTLRNNEGLIRPGEQVGTRGGAARLSAARRRHHSRAHDDGIDDAVGDLKIGPGAIIVSDHSGHAIRPPVVPRRRANYVRYEPPHLQLARTDPHPIHSSLLGILRGEIAHHSVFEVNLKIQAGVIPNNPAAEVMRPCPHTQRVPNLLHRRAQSHAKHPAPDHDPRVRHRGNG